MNFLVQFLERFIVPIAAKIGNEKHLLALRDAFISMMPITMSGAFAVMLNAIIRDLPSDPNVLGYDNPITNSWLGQQIIGINGIVWTGTLAIIALALVVTLGYYIARAYNTNGVAGSLVALAAYIMGLPSAAATTTTLQLSYPLPIDIANMISANAAATIAQDGMSIAVSGSAWGFFQFSQFFGASGMFGVIVTSYISVIIFSFMMNKKITIKLPDSVPPTVANAFTSIIPGVTALFFMGILYRIWNLNINLPFSLWIMERIQAPLLEISQGYFAVFIIVLLVHLLWFFGLHGANIMQPILQTTYGVAQLENVEAFQLGHEIPHLWTSSSFEAFVWPGGAGASLVLIIAILIFSKRKDYRSIGKLSLGPGIFNINEPVMFGLPVVLNPLMFIPFILAPILTATIAYFATISGILSPMVIPVVWVMPTILSGFFGTAFDFMAIVVTLVNLLVAFVIWAPFIIAANRMEEKNS